MDSYALPLMFATLQRGDEEGAERILRSFVPRDAPPTPCRTRITAAQRAELDSIDGYRIALEKRRAEGR